MQFLYFFLFDKFFVQIKFIVCYHSRYGARRLELRFCFYALCISPLPCLNHHGRQAERRYDGEAVAVFFICNLYRTILKLLFFLEIFMYVLVPTKIIAVVFANT